MHMTADSAALVAENRKHKYNDRKCEELLGWVCIPLVVETYGCWGAAAVAAFSKLTGRLSTRLNQPKSKTIFGIYSHLGLALTYGNWGREAQSNFSRLASHLAINTSSHKSKVLTELYSRLNFTLVRAVARALLARCAPSLGLQDIV
ncbi:hypothetical protein EMCRGX_G003164 [Ephydatia muelleri]